MKPKVIVIVGPTASGKSDFAVELARRIGGEVVSADSRQVYTGLDIGTGKITEKEMRGVPHHMLDVASPRRVFTAHDYVRKARPILADIIRRGKVPIICGGTGFYIDALLGRIQLPDTPASPALRKELKAKTAPELYETLRKLDPRRAESIDRHNPARLIRAIEIATALGSVPPMKIQPLPYDVVWFGVCTPEASWRAAVRVRLLSRMKAGMLNEARQLHAEGLSYRRMEELGLEYRHLARLLKGEVSESAMLEALERDIVRYGKRQRTYLRKNKHIVWLPENVRTDRVTTAEKQLQEGTHEQDALRTRD